MKIKDLNQDGLAFDGHDPVAYHEGEPLLGQPQYRFEWQGVRYQFANRENLERFQEDPSRFTGPLQGSLSLGKHSRAQEHRNLEDKKDDREVNVPLEPKETGSIEMQNLSDSKK